MQLYFILKAIDDKAVECLELLKRGMDVNSSIFASTGRFQGEEEYIHYTPLHFACANGALNTVKVLLEHGADANKTSSWEGGPHCPISLRHRDVSWYSRK